MEFRELTEADLAALLDLCQRTLPLDRFSASALRRHVLDEPSRNAAFQLGLWDGARLAAVMLGGVRDGEDGPTAWMRLFAVDQAYRRQGLTSRLLEELENRFRAAGLKRVRVGNSTPNYFWPGLDVRYTSAFCFLEKYGFRRYGDAVNMQVDLLARDWNTATAEARLAQAGYVIRRLCADDRDQFSHWLQRQWSEIWRAEALVSLDHDPISTFVATHEGCICAFASYNVTTFENVFGPTGTAPSLQGQGLGRVLFYRCMCDLKTLGYQHAEICWVGPITFYTRVADAWISRVFWFMEKEL